MADLKLWLRSALKPDSAAEYAADSLPVIRFERLAGEDNNSVAIENQHWAIIGNLEAAQTKRGVTVVIPADLCFRRQSELPRASSPQLSEIMDVEFAGISPAGRSEFMGGSYALAAAGDRTSIVAEQILVKRSIVTSLLSAMTAAGLKVSALAFSGSTGELLPVFFHSNGEAYAGARLRLWLRWALGSVALAFCLYGGFFMAVSWQEESLSWELIKERQMLESQAQAVRQQLAAQKSASDSLLALIEAEKKNERVLSSLNEITRLLPDEAYLQDLNIDGRELTLDGLATAPETLISTFEKSPYFTSASFLAPIYRDPQSGRSHFTLKADIEGYETEKTPP